MKEVEGVRLSGVSVKKATGHNAFFIANGFRTFQKKEGLKKKPIGPGAILRVTRSGDVIPHIVEVVRGAAKPDFPKTGYKWDANGVEIMSIGGESESDLVRDKRITEFFVTLGVDGIKLGTVQQLADAGLDSIVKILRAPASRFLEIPGFKDKKAQTLYANIRAKTKEVPLNVLMDGSGHFGAGFGSKRLELLVKAYPKMLSWEGKSADFIKEKVLAVPGFKQRTAEQFAVGFPKFMRWFHVVNIKPTMPKEVKVTGKALAGKSITFTGFRDTALETKIQANGGKVGSGVSKLTNVLLVASKGSGSSKATKARALNIPVMTAEEFIKKYRL